MNTLWTIAGGIASLILIAGTVAAFGRWIHRQIVSSVAEQLRPIDDAVNHREPGQPKMIEVVDMIWEEVQRQGVEIDHARSSLDRHLGWHEGSGLS